MIEYLEEHMLGAWQEQDPDLDDQEETVNWPSSAPYHVPFHTL